MTDALLLTPADPRLGFWAPQPVDRTRAEARLDRFPPAVAGVLAGQIGPLANIRSSSGCAVVVDTDAPWVELRLDRLRHHQMVAQAIACEVEDETGALTTMVSEDLREREGAVALRFGTGGERGRERRRVWCWLPTISTAAVAGVLLPRGSTAVPPVLPKPQWLALGDSLTQGFSVAAPTQAWVHRCARRWQLPVWNLGIGGLRIETEVFRWALAGRRWPLVTIALGSNHAWRDSDADAVGERAAALATLVVAGGHGRIVWLLPPWKPCEAGQGPAEFAGIPLDAAAGTRLAHIRTQMRAALAPWREQITVVEDLGAHDHRLYPDGLHPLAWGAARYADQVDAAIRRGAAKS